MGAVAVVALGGLRVAQLRHLAVVGACVGIQAVLVAVTAITGNEQPAGVGLWFIDVVRGVAVGAHRRMGIAVGYLLAVNRSEIDIALPAVALAANIRRGESRLGADMVVDRADVMRIVTVVTACVGPRLVRHAGAGVDGAHVAFDLLHDDAQPGVFLHRACLLYLVPQLGVTLHAAHFALDSLAVGRLDNVLVAVHAILAAMHALREGFGINMQVALFAILRLPGKTLSAVAAQAP